MHLRQVSQATDVWGGDSVYSLRFVKVLGLLATVSLLAACNTQSTSPAPVHNLSESKPVYSSSSVATGQTYTVKPGDTLRKIAISTGADESTMIRLNNLSNPNSIQVGQVLRLSDKGDSGVVVAPVTPPTKPPARPVDSASASETGPYHAAPDGPVTRAADAASLNLAWPANGSVIQAYSATTKGIDIGGNVGDPVVAAASGKVVYAGNGIRGLGNLVIVQHDNGFITAYAHNKVLLVKTDQMVKQGSKIAELGQSDTTSPRLHFELRRQNSPVDPMQYLPAK